MRRFLLLISMVVALCSVTRAAEVTASPVTFDFSTMGYTNAQEVTDCEINPVTLKFDKGTNSNTPKYYTSGKAIRVYGGGTCTISVASGFKITEVQFTTPTGSYSVNSASTFKSNGETVGKFANNTWTVGDTVVTELVFTQGGTSGHVRIQKLVVSYEAAVAPSVVAPTFSLVEGVESFSVEMTTETEGAEIFYTEDGTVPTPESAKYTAPVEVSRKTTFKAVAIKDGESSSVATYEANPPYIFTDFTPLSDFAPASDESIPVIIKGEMTVLYQSGSYLQVKAGNSYMLVYGRLDKELANGDTFGRLEGDFVLYNGLPEIKNPRIVGDVTPGSPVAPTPAYLDEVAQDRINQYLIVRNVNISGCVEDSKDATITDGNGNEVALRNNYNVALENLENCTIVGFVGIYISKGNTTIQFVPVEIIPGAPEPVVTVNGEPVSGSTINLNEGEEAVIEFTLAEGVEVYYNITETAAEEIAPAAEEEMEFTKYTEPVKISKSSIMTYYSVANGVKSDVATLTVSGTTAITGIMVGEGSAEYFDLMGRRVENPANGLYIRRAAGKVEKVLVK